MLGWAGEPVFTMPLSFQIAQSSAGGEEKHSLSFEKPLGKSILGIFKRHNDITRNNTHSTTERRQMQEPRKLAASSYFYKSPTCGIQQRNTMAGREEMLRQDWPLPEPFQVRTLPAEGRIPNEEERLPFSMTRNQSLPARLSPHSSSAVYYTDVLGYGAVWMLTA